MMNQASLEINAEHPIIKKLREVHKADAGSAETKDLTHLVYEIAALTGGYQIEDPKAFASRVTSVVTKGVT